MKKKLLVLLVCFSMIFAFAACGSNGGGDAEADGQTVKIGLICIGDENDQGYTYNFIRGKDEATEALAAEGINVEWIIKYNIGEDDSCTDANVELAEEGCAIIFNNSFGHEQFMLKVAPDYPDIQFVGCTNSASAVDELANTHNAFANIFEGRYVAGVVAGMKLQRATRVISTSLFDSIVRPWHDICAVVTSSTSTK